MIPFVEVYLSELNYVEVWEPQVGCGVFGYEVKFVCGQVAAAPECPQSYNMRFASCGLVPADVCRRAL